MCCAEFCVCDGLVDGISVVWCCLCARKYVGVCTYVCVWVCVCGCIGQDRYRFLLLQKVP